MPANTNAIFPIVPISQSMTFVNADGTSIKSIYAHGLGNGARIDTILVTNSDSSDYTFQLFLKVGDKTFLLGSANIPANSGNNANTQPLNLLAAISAASSGPLSFVMDPYGNLIFPVGPNIDLAGSLSSSISPGATITVTTFGGEY